MMNPGFYNSTHLKECCADVGMSQHRKRTDPDEYTIYGGEGTSQQDA
jgi:hypothetical protein